MPVTPTASLPDRARVIVIGGGVIGCSIAYHLAHEGWTDVVVLERDRLTSGTTWHAAGLMTCFGSTSETSTGIRLYSRDLYARLEAETGVSTGFKPVGLIEAAADADRLHEYRRVAAFQRHFGLEVEEIGPREMKDLFPWAETDDLLAGFHVPGDGRVNPVDLTQALARGAKNLGVRVIEECAGRGGLVTSGDVTGVRLETGEQIECEYVVNCTGMWAREEQLGERSGLVIPNQAAEHYYLITDTIDGIDPNAPIFEDPASHGYYREEGGGMMVGLFEPRAAAWSVDGIPRDATFTTLKPDWDRMGPFLEKAMARVPITLEVGVRTFFCGPESFTPDLMPAVGEARRRASAASFDAWMLMLPWRGHARTAGGRMSPYAATTSTSMRTAVASARPSGVLSVAGWSTGMPCAAASSFTGDGATLRPRPCGRSGRVRTTGTAKPRRQDGGERFGGEGGSAGKADAQGPGGHDGLRRAGRDGEPSTASRCFLRCWRPAARASAATGGRRRSCRSGGPFRAVCIRRAGPPRSA